MILEASSSWVSYMPPLNKKKKPQTKVWALLHLSTPQRGKESEENMYMTSQSLIQVPSQARHVTSLPWSLRVQGKI